MTLERRMKSARKRHPDLFHRSFPLFPDERDRGFWDNVAVSLSFGGGGSSETAAPAENWPVLTASMFRDFRRNGDRSRYEVAHFRRRRLLGDMAVKGVLHPGPADAAKLIDALWSVCEESFWGVPAHNAVAGRDSPDLCDTDEPILDLFAAETAALLAWTVHLKGPTLEAESPLAVLRVLKELDRRAVRPFLERDDFWWMGENLAPGQRVNNWNPWIVSNVLTVVLLLDAFDEVRVKTVAKACRLLDRFLAEYGPDGGCDEGPGYWTKAGAALFDSLDQLYKASGGAFNAFGEPLVQEIGRYVMKMHIAGDYYVNFADGPAVVRHVPGDLVMRYGKRIGDADLAAFGSRLAARQRNTADFGDVPESLLRRLQRLSAPENDPTPPAPAASPAETVSSAEPIVYAPAVSLQYWLPDIQVMTARSVGDPERGLYLACKGGHNEENHNHNDVGNFIVYADGRPLVADAGVGVYTAKTFSSRRYEIWTMRSSYHNLPEINGREQPRGRRFAARGVECRLAGREAALSMELAGAYPEDAGVATWRRSARLLRGDDENGEDGSEVVVTDDFSLTEPSADLAWSLITPARPGRLESGTAVLALPGGNPVVLDVSGGPVMEIEELDTSDERLSASWPDGLRRLRFRMQNPVKGGIVGFRFSRPHRPPSSASEA